MMHSRLIDGNALFATLKDSEVWVTPGKRGVNLYTVQKLNDEDVIDGSTVRPSYTDLNSEDQWPYSITLAKILPMNHTSGSGGNSQSAKKMVPPTRIERATRGDG